VSLQAVVLSAADCAFARQHTLTKAILRKSIKDFGYAALPVMLYHIPVQQTHDIPCKQLKTGNFLYYLCMDDMDNLDYAHPVHDVHAITNIRTLYWHLNGNNRK
jgi:hypothetical protein